MADQLSFSLLGSPQILLDGTSLLPSTTRKAQALLIYLVITPGPHSRDALSGLLWPEMSTAKARNNLRTILHEVRALRHTYLEITRQTIAFQHNSNYWLDVEILQAQLTGQLVEPDLERWRTTLALYRGDFLSGFHINDAVNFEEWVRTQREQLYTLFVNGTATLSQLALTHKAYAVGLAINSHLLTIAPTMEQAHLQQMRLLALSGRRSEALAQYDLCCQLLKDEFQIEPSLPLQELRAAILAGDESPGQEAITQPIQAQSRQVPAELLPALQQEPMPTQFLPLRPQRFFYVPEVGNFYGREAELATLHDWISAQQIHVVMILGIGGMGKTALAASFVRSLPPTAFRFVIWHSLLNAPPLAEILQSWIEILSEQTIAQLPTSLDRQFDLLLEQLQQQRCLLILDNAESIMADGERSGMFRPGYEGYGQLLQWVAEQSHRSCLLLTSREEPYGIQERVLKPSAIRMLHLPGLLSASAQLLLQEQGLSKFTSAHAALLDHYGGNPLALKLSTAIIQELFGGDVQSFLHAGSLVFESINDVLDQHFARLSDNEMTLLYWLAIEREPVPFWVLRGNIVSSIPRERWIEAIRSLRRRSLLERQGELFQLQNVILEYVTNRLVNAISQEILDFSLAATQATAHRPFYADASQLMQSHCNRFALVKAQAKEYVRVSQVRMLLTPVVNQLLAQLSKATSANNLRRLLEQLRTVAPLAPGYAAANLFHLLRHLQVDLRSYDFSYLNLRQVDLRQVSLPEVNLTNADLSQSLFIEPIEIARCLSVSSTGDLLATGTANGQIQIWQLADHQLIRQLPAHVGPVYTVAFSLDGLWLASGGADNMVYLWDVATGECRCRLRGHVGEVLLVGFAAEGQRLFSLSHDNTLCLWEMARLLTMSSCDQPYRRVNAGMGNIYRAAGSTVAVGGGDSNLIYCWDTLSGQLEATLLEEGSIIIGLTASLDGKLVASSSNDQTIRIWVRSAQSTLDAHQSPMHVLPVPANVLAFSPDSALLASAYDEALCLWEIATGRLCWRVGSHQGRIMALAFSADGRKIVSTSYDQTTRIWDVSAGQVEHILYGQASWVDFVKFSPDGSTLVSSAVDKTAHLWTQNGRHLHALRGHHGTVQHYGYSLKHPLLAIGSGLATTIHVWDMNSGDIRHILRQQTGAITANFAVSPDEHTLATGSEDKTICLWDLTTGELRTVLHGHTSRVKYIAFNSSGALLATASSDHTVCIWSMPEGYLKHSLRGHDALCSILAFHPNDRLLASAGEDSTVCLWDTVTGQLSQTLAEHTQSVLYVNFSCDGQWLVSIGEDLNLCVWAVDPATGLYELRHMLHEHIFKLNCAVFMPDGRSLVTGGMDMTVRMWDLEQGQAYGVFQGHSNIITSVDINPNGQQIASSSSDGTVRLWDVQTGQCLHILRPEGPYVGMNITGVTGITDAQRAALKALGAVEDDGEADSGVPRTHQLRENGDAL